MKKILSILGDYYHNHDIFLETLGEVLKSFSDMEIVDSNSEEFLNHIKEKPFLIVIAKENRLNPEDKDIKTWMDGNIEKEIVRYVEEGGILFSWHSGLASYSPNGPYIKLLRGYFKYHPEKQKEVRYYSQNFFLGEEIDFKIVDEQYFVECDEKNTNIFLISESIDGKSIGGWTHNLGRGRVICLTPAHKEGLENKNFRNFLQKLFKKILF